MQKKFKLCLTLKSYKQINVIKLPCNFMLCKMPSTTPTIHQLHLIRIIANFLHYFSTWPGQALTKFPMDGFHLQMPGHTILLMWGGAHPWEKGIKWYAMGSCSNVYTCTNGYLITQYNLRMHGTWMWGMNKISIKMFECRFVGGPIHEPTFTNFSLHIVTTIVHAKDYLYTLLRFDIY